MTSFFFQSHRLFLEQVRCLTLYKQANSRPKLERQRRHLDRLSVIWMSFFFFFFKRVFTTFSWHPVVRAVFVTRESFVRFAFSVLFHCTLLAHGSECYFIWWKLPVIAFPRRCSVPVQAHQHSTVHQSISASGGKLYNLPLRVHNWLLLFFVIFKRKPKLVDNSNVLIEMHV